MTSRPGNVSELSDSGLDLLYLIDKQAPELGITEPELAQGLAEAFERISHGPCRFCGETDELRYGGCFDCVIGDVADD